MSCRYSTHRSVALAVYDHRQSLRHVPLFESLDDEAARKLCQLLQSIDCKAINVFVRAPATRESAMYLIERGKVPHLPCEPPMDAT